MINKKVVICGTARNVGNNINKVFSNIYKIRDLFIESIVIVYYDKSDDNTLELLKKENILIIENKEELHPLRVARICNGRNRLMDYINKNNFDPDYMIMLDLDDVCSQRININILLEDLKNDNHWSAMTYNKKDYYDIFALCYDSYTYNCWSYGHLSPQIVNIIKKDITEKLNECSDYLEVKSAFNGFGIYKWNEFKNCTYGCNKLSLPNQLPYQTYDIKENCEHIKFHLEAIIKNKAKIKINKKILF
tara:strand:+ start:124 stop:867 length:744 start_codon:yes stop_codon:yes gene_type:complete